MAAKKRLSFSGLFYTLAVILPERRQERLLNFLLFIFSVFV